MNIHKLQLGELRANSYIAETGQGHCVAVDIGGDSKLLLNFLAMKKLKLTKILLTHGHFDHMGGVAEVAKATGAEVYIHKDDAYMLESSSDSLADLFSFVKFNPISEYKTVSDGDIINDYEKSFRVLHTPGHSMGSVCYICDDVIFSGDTLFCCSIGRTDYVGGDPKLMLSSLKRINELEGDYRIYPGHNDTTTLNYERGSNPYLKRL